VIFSDDLLIIGLNLSYVLDYSSQNRNNLYFQTQFFDNILTILYVVTPVNDLLHDIPTIIINILTSIDSTDQII